MSHDEFNDHRGLLVAVAYRMVGSHAEAEDIVQDAWIRWNSTLRRGTVVDNPRGYLIQVVTRLALDHLGSARVRRETYVGPWLPEPTTGQMTGGAGAEDPQEALERDDTASLGMMVVLESLSPAERVVFVLREAFGLPLAQIAGILDKSDAAVRQLAGRARSHVEERRARFENDPARRREATKRFVDAATSGDLAQLLRLLAPDATLVVDTDGKVRGPKRPIRTADNIARLFAAIHDQVPPGTNLEFTDVNGAPAALLHLAGQTTSVFSIEISGDRVDTVYWIANPEKLSRVSPGA